MNRKENIIKNFLKFVSYDTQSEEESNTYPSTLKQLELSKYLVNVLKEIGIDNAYMDEFGYVYGFLKGTGLTYGLVAHVDTACELTGLNVKPQIFDKYDGGIIKLNDEKSLDPKVFTHMASKVGHTLITTSGDTLLGGDDKAGVAIIVQTIKEIIDNNLPHPNIIITFTPDEEVGGGTDHFNFDYYKEHNCSFAYTVDGGKNNIINFENFNAASAKVTVTGSSIHPGDAYKKMVNSLKIAIEFNEMLPKQSVPELTKDYEGFNHLLEINGSCNETVMSYIIRNHDMNVFNSQKVLFKDITDFLNKKYDNRVKLELHDTYYNMRDLVISKQDVLEYPVKAMNRLNMNPTFVPIRGGTDGARLSFEGIITPNLGTGDYNCHGAYEYVDVDEMCSMVDVILEMNKIMLDK